MFRLFCSSEKPVSTSLSLSHGSLSDFHNPEELREAHLYKQFRFVRAFEFLMLFSYESLTDQALQLVNCIRVGECGRVLAEFPDVSCDDASYTPLKITAVVILVYSVLFPLLLFRKLQLIHRAENAAAHNYKTLPHSCRQINVSGDPSDNHGNDRSHLIIERHNALADQNAVSEAQYGIFYDHFKPNFFWWEVQVRAKI